MSLNGLDDAKVKEAHDAAVAEPGGWFLLKYVSRDEIDLLGRGNGGIVEIRNAIASYEEPSPLFGFLRYRRRNVIIKYVPDDCSRLVQARVTVHFNAVTERFSPHDTVFPITSSKDLRDTTLSAACSLHTASGSTSSSTSSLRRRRLMEIAEDTEEENRAKRQSTVPEETRPSTAKTTTSQPTGPTSAQDQPPTVPELTKEIENSPALPNLETSPPPPREPRASIDEPQPRLSSQSTRPNLFSYTSYGSNGKPKVKLGPRPSLDTGKQRPHTSGAASLYRPISTLPAGLKLFSRGSKKGKESKERPKSHYATEGVSIDLSPPSVPESMALSPQTAPARPHTSGGRPNTSSGASIKPLASPTASHTPKIPTITPEKARLMKALELRKKQKTSTPTITTTTTTTETLTTNEIAKAPTPLPGQPEPMEAPQDVPKTPDMLDDSAIAFDAASANKTDESDATRTDSYPTSPVGPSSKAESTRASSISESTDETVYAASKPIEETGGKKVVQAQPTESADSETVRETPTITKVEHSILVDPVPVAKEAGQGIKAEASTNLPQLQAVTYEPPPFSIAVPVPEHQREPTPVESVPPKEEKKTVEPKDADAEVRAEIAKINAEIKAEMDAAAATENSVSETEKDGGKSSEGAISSDAVVAEASEVKTESREMKTPKLKFSMPVLQAANDVPTIITEPVPASNNQESPALSSKFATQDIKDGGGTDAVTADPLTTSESQATLKPTSSVSSISSRPEDSADNGSLSRKKSKRRGLIEPIRTDLEVSDRSGGTSEANFSSDDELMDELQSAVIEDAKPISVSKSPLSPVFPSLSPTKKEGNRFSRAFSNPLGRKTSTKSEMLAAPDTPASTRSVSASAYLNRISQQPSAPMAKKVNLGGGIAQRIKALEQLQSSAPGSTPAPGTSGPPPGSTPAFFSVRKSVVRPVSRSPSIAERANSLTKNSPGNSRESSPEAFKLRERSGSVQNRLDAFKSSPLPSSSSPGRARPESISVTARIIRDPNQLYPQKPEVGKDPLDYAPLDFKQSPLVIDHQKAIATEAVAHKETIQERRLSKESKKERRSSITIVKDLINEGRKSLSERRRSITLEPSSPEKAMKSPSRPPSVHASPAFHKPISITSGISVSSPAISPPPTANSSSSVEDKSDKKPNRASRMIRRMSSSLSKGRNNISHAISPTVREDPEPESHDIDTRSIISSVFPSQASMVMTPTLSDVGDVNVQFPDTLLWKRRSMGLDSQGFLVLAPALSAHKVGDKATTRRFHLSEFSTPAIPEMEMQELPNSVVLDFLEGSGLQIACEDRAGQARVLRVLQDAHRLWTTQ